MRSADDHISRRNEFGTDPARASSIGGDKQTTKLIDSPQLYLPGLSDCAAQPIPPECHRYPLTLLLNDHRGASVWVANQHLQPRLALQFGKMIPAMNSGRKETRLDQKFEVWLSGRKQAGFAEPASMENISSYGMRVRTERPWLTDTRLFVKSPQGESWLCARVVYCQVLQNPESFALGLELARSGGDA